MIEIEAPTFEHGDLVQLTRQLAQQERFRVHIGKPPLNHTGRTVQKQLKGQAFVFEFV